MKRPALRKALTTQASSFIAGMGALASIWPASDPLSYPKRTEMQALRSDAVRIGDDMRRVIDRENARLKASSE